MTNVRFRKNLDLPTNLQPDLSGNPFLWLQLRWQKDWERKADNAAQIFIKISVYQGCLIS
jgi:hypothetical protein